MNTTNCSLATAESFVRSHYGITMMEAFSLFQKEQKSENDKRAADIADTLLRNEHDPRRLKSSGFTATYELRKETEPADPEKVFEHEDGFFDL